MAKSMYLLNIEYKLIVDNFNETFKIELNRCEFEDIYKINSICNNLGYFISKLKVFRNDKTDIQY
jgi:hypothetical protein